MMRPDDETVIDPVAKTVTIPLPTYIRMTRGSYGNNGLVAEELDDFLMYVYKVRRCPQKLPHNWTDCPYAHRGEKAKRRDPRKFPYHGTACLEWKHTEDCSRGKNCEFAHGVFEYWLHPSRYRTKVCDDGLSCTRKICFFAHTPQQLRSTAPSYSRLREITKPMAATNDPFAAHVPVPAAASLAPRAGGSRSAISSLCHGCGVNVVTSRAVAPCYYCKECIDAAEKAAIAAMTTHAFAAPMTGRRRGGEDYVALPPMMASPAPRDPPSRMTVRGKEAAVEEEDFSGLPDLHWVEDLIE